MVNIITNTNKFCEVEIGPVGFPSYCVYINKRTCYVKFIVMEPFSDLFDGYTNSEMLVVLPIFLRHLKSIGNLMQGDEIDRRLLRMLLNFLNI